MYGLIGYPLGHSLSAEIFNTKFKEEGAEDIYRLYPLPNLEDFVKLIKENPGLKGLNVTIPYKEESIKYIDILSDESREIGAVNVVKIIRNDNDIVLKGYNTDYYGFKESLRPLLKSREYNALVLGNGGAAKAVCHALKSLDIPFLIVSRQIESGDLTYQDIKKDIISHHKLIINTTPVGMYPEIDKCPDLHYDFIGEHHICYDLIYNPIQTKFLKLCKDRGAITKNGMEMLYLQALKSLEIWTSEQ